MSGARRWVLLLTLSVLSLFSRHATAAAGSAPIVNIEVQGSPAAVDRLRTTALEVLGRLGVVPVVVASPAPDARGLPVPVVRAEVDLRNPRQPSLVVRDGASGRELGRRTLERSASLETSVEAAVLVVYMIVEARLSEETPPPVEASPPAPSAAPASPPPPPPPAAPATAKPAPSPPPAPAPPKETAKKPEPRREVVEPSASEEEPEEIMARARPTTPSAVSVSAGALLRVGTLDNASAITGGGLLLEARGKRSQFGGLLLGAAHLPSDVEYASSNADVHTVSARLLATQGFGLGSSVSALVGMGPGLDWLRSVPGSVPSEVQSGGTVNVVDPILSAALGARVSLGRHALLMAAACLDLDIAPHTFVIDVGTERHTLLAPERLRPSLLVAIAYTSGDDQTASRSRALEVW